MQEALMDFRLRQPYELFLAVLGLAPCHDKVQITSRYVDPASRIDITEWYSRLRWLLNYDIPCSPLPVPV